MVQPGVLHRVEGGRGNKMNDTERDELLIRVDERVCSLTKHFTNHIKHHWMVAIPVIMLVLGLVVALLAK